MININEKRLRELMRVITFSAGALGVHGLKQAIFTGGGMVKGPGGQLAENNDFALYLNMMIPVIYYVGGRIQSRRWRHLFYFMAIASGISVIFSYSRGGYLGLAALILLLSAKANRKMLGILGLIFFVVMFLLFAPQRVMDRFLSIRTAHETDPSAMARLEAWRTALMMIKAHPILGVGPRNFPLLYETFNPTSSPYDTHNGYLRTAAETGLPAMFIFLYLIFGSWAKLRRKRKFLEANSGPPDLIAYCHGIEVGLIGYSIGNLFGSRQDLESFYYLLAIAICIHMQARVWAEAHAPTDARTRLETLRARLAPSGAAMR
jgi:probable O-glycosylation ligase (exosortase A-associated)